MLNRVERVWLSGDRQFNQVVRCAEKELPMRLRSLDYRLATSLKRCLFLECLWRLLFVRALQFIIIALIALSSEKWLVLMT